MSTLTKRQKEIFDYIKNYLKKNGISPSLEEIKDHFKLSAKSTAHEHLSALVEKGFLKKSDNIERGYELNEMDRNLIAIPLVGTITAGQPIEAIEIPSEAVKIARDQRFAKGELYALKVKGNSMIGDGIFDNDIVIVKKQATADNGDTVVAIVDENEATLKRYYKEKGRVRLQPANPTFSPIYRQNVEVRGIVIKIIRNFHS